MRIISCHIENFGRLHNLDMTFSEGLNVICRENGWGKSTLAAFIKAMLYGLDGSKKRDLDENERKKYAPWQGGVFGGRLDFETGGKRYSVTRTFGDVPAKDTFELRSADTNLPSDDYPECIGEQLFKLNSASFYRSIFIGQGDCPTSSTDDIHAKIGGLADNTGDMNSYESADERLKKQMNRLSPNLKTGSLFRLSQEISDLRRRVSEGNDLRKEIAGCETEIEDAETRMDGIKEKRAALESEQKRAIRMQRVISLRAEWERLKKSRDNSKRTLDAAREKFPSGIPGEKEVNKYIGMSVEMKSAGSLMHSYKLSEYEEENLSRLREIFDREIPSPDSFDRYFSLEKELRRVRDKYERLRLTDEEHDALLRLGQTFAADSMTPSELAAKWNERVSLNSTLDDKRRKCAVLEKRLKKERSAVKRRSFVLSAAGCAIILLALSLFMFFADIRFLVGVIAGIPFLGAGLFLAVMVYGNIIKKAPEELLAVREDILRSEKCIIETDALTESFLSAHGMLFSEPDVPLLLQEIYGEKRELDRLRAKNETAENYRRESHLTAILESIGAFLGKYGVHPEGDRLSDQLHELRESVSEYESLSEKRKKYTTARQKYDAAKSETERFIEAYGAGGHGDVYKDMESLRADLAEYDRMAALHSSAEEQLSEFEQSHDITELSSPDADSISSPEELGDEIRLCGKSLEEISASVNTLKQSRSDLYKKLSEWERDSADLNEKKEKYAADRLRYDRIVLTRELLRKAKESMLAKYVEPVYQSFVRYYETVTGVSPDNYRLDADVTLTVEELGRQRAVKTLSAGFRDLAGICLRLGLADAMYREEKPMLIMDDPFTNLDDEKGIASKKLLGEVSKDYQVIYFTCSSARK